MAKIGKLGKLNLKWGQVMNVLLIVFVVLGLYYLVYHTDLFGMRMYEGLKNKSDKSDKSGESGESGESDESDESETAAENTQKIKRHNRAIVKGLEDDKKGADDGTSKLQFGMKNTHDLDNAAASIKGKKKTKVTEYFHNMLENMAPYASNPMQPADMPNWFLDKTKFSPTCCPSTYSSGTGCACLSPQQMSYLNQRGGNRTSASLY